MSEIIVDFKEQRIVMKEGEKKRVFNCDKPPSLSDTLKQIFVDIVWEHDKHSFFNILTLSDEGKNFLQKLGYKIRFDIESK